MMTKTFPALTVLLGVLVSSSALAQGCEDQRRWPWSDHTAITAALRSEYMQLHASYQAMSCTGRPSVLTGAERYCGAMADRLVAIHHELERNHWLGKRVTACGPEGTRPPLALEPVEEEAPVKAEAPAKPSKGRVAKAARNTEQPLTTAAQADAAPSANTTAPTGSPKQPMARRNQAEADPTTTPDITKPAAPSPRPSPVARAASATSQPAQARHPPSQPQNQARVQPQDQPPAQPNASRPKRPQPAPLAAAPSDAPQMVAADPVLILPQPTPRPPTARPMLATRSEAPATQATPPKSEAQARPREPAATSPNPDATLALVAQFAAEPEATAAISAGYFATVSGAGLYTAAEPPIEPAGSPTRKRFMAKGGRFACVRSCDGFYFPLNQSVRGGDAQDMCTSLCPGARTEVYRVPQGGRMADAVSMKGQRYADLRSAFLYRRKVNAGCGCKVQGQSWEALLRPAERVLASPHRDPILDEATADRLSRAQQRAKLRAEAAQEAASREPAAQQAAGGAPPIAPQRQPSRPTPAAQRLEEPRQENEPAETGSIRLHRRR